MREALLAIVKQPAFALEIDIPDELRAPALKELAFAGFRLYQAIFAGSFASDELKKVGRWLRESLAEDFTTLQVVSRGFPVPWALMYLTDRFADDKLDWHDFIGMRHVVEQVPLREISAMPPATTIASTPDLSVRVLFNEGIEAQMPSRPISAQRAYWSHRGVALGEGTLVDDLVKSALAPSATDKVLYLYCHAVASDKDSDDSYLVLSNEERISLGQLAVYAPIEDQLPTHPLVIINACESGDLSPTFYDGFVPYFLAKGARGRHRHGMQDAGSLRERMGDRLLRPLLRGRAARRRRARAETGLPRQARQPARPALRSPLRHGHARRPGARGGSRLSTTGQEHAMALRRIPGKSQTYHLISYDRKGREQRDEDGAIASETALEAIAAPGITDVFVLSHGWQGDHADAISQYDRWVGAADPDTDTDDVRPVVIGAPLAEQGMERSRAEGSALRSAR